MGKQRGKKVLPDVFAVRRNNDLISVGLSYKEAAALAESYSLAEPNNIFTIIPNPKGPEKEKE
jgi:hypothetical protein